MQDSGGIVTIGTTSTTPAFSTTNGHAFHVGDASHISRSGGVGIIFNRASNNGEIAQFRYGGNHIGGIGVEGGDSLFIQSDGSTGGGLRFHQNGAISPVRNGAVINNAIDLGTSTQQFRELYLGSGLFMSGSQIVDSSRNLTNIGTISSGAITSAGTGTFNELTLTGGSDNLTFTETGGDWSIKNAQQSNGIVIYDGSGGVEIHYNNAAVAEFDSAGGMNIVSGELRMGGTTRIGGGGTATFAGVNIISSGMPTLTLYDNGNGGGGAAEAKIEFTNTAGTAVAIGYTDDQSGDTDLIISTNAAGTYGGYLGLTAAAINDAQSDIILEPKTDVRIATGGLKVGTSTVIDSSRNLTNIASIATGTYKDSTDTFLFRYGTGSGTTRHLNLWNSTSDPSNADGTGVNGITWGQRSDDQAYYLIYVDRENYGGYNYSRLRLNWHTGIQIGASQNYGGTRFYGDSRRGDGGGTLIFSVGDSDSFIRSYGGIKLGSTETTFVDVNRNVTAGTITSGAITASGNISLNTADGFVYLNNVGTGNAGIYVRGITSSNTLRSHSTNNFRWEVTGAQKMELDSSGVLNAVGGYEVNGTTVISSGRKGTFSGGIDTNNSQLRVKISPWTGTTYGYGMKSGMTFGGLSSNYALTFQMNSSTGRGFWWGMDTHSDAQGAMALTNDGKLTVNHSLRLGYGVNDTTTPGATHALDVSGSISSGAITSSGNLTVKGTQGFNATGETASIYLGDTNSEIRATYN
ncbi:MAG: hypothetical protein L7S70_04430, partial [Pseudomonadales bacterium]|nr:hypothetical protein [Pseudomonadales bacterium]